MEEKVMILARVGESKLGGVIFVALCKNEEGWWRTIRYDVPKRDADEFPRLFKGTMEQFGWHVYIADEKEEEEVEA